VPPAASGLPPFDCLSARASVTAAARPVVSGAPPFSAGGADAADRIVRARHPRQVDKGNYAGSLARWNLSAEAIEQSRANPPGLPKS
jgi:polar amino acid transport system substrate-binding protein